MHVKLSETIEKKQDEINFSGAVLISQNSQLCHQSATGFADRSNQLMNEIDTRFGIASGCKLFTAISVCQLEEAGKLTFQTRLNDCLPFEFPHFDKTITIHQLLTHTAGIPDYFDEEVMDDFEELWLERPMYSFKEPRDFLPLFQNQKMKAAPGKRFHYNNAGFILLGLIVEQLSGQRFTDYVQAHIFDRCGMESSGYFSMDRLPANTALGYIDEQDGSWKTNVYSLPIIGGADGGAFVTAQDMLKLWNALQQEQLLSKELCNKLLSPHVFTGNENEYYGYGVWITKKEDAIFKCHVMGYDPGVCFHSAVYPETGHQVAILSNTNAGAYNILTAFENSIY